MRISSYILLILILGASGVHCAGEKFAHIGTYLFPALIGISTGTIVRLSFETLEKTSWYAAIEKLRSSGIALDYMKSLGLFSLMATVAIVPAFIAGAYAIGYCESKFPHYQKRIRTVAALGFAVAFLPILRLVDKIY